MENENVMTMPGAAPAVPQTAYEAPKPEIKRHDGVFVWVTLLLGFMIIRYCFFNTNGFFTTAAFLLTFVCSAVYLLMSGLRPTVRQWISGGVICLFTVVFSITASGLLHVLDFLFLAAMQFWWVQAVCIKARFVTRYFGFDLMRTVFAQPFFDFFGGFRALRSGNGKGSGAVRTVIVGLCATVPLTLIVAVLLSMADESINRLFSEMTDYMLEQDIFTLIPQLFFTLPAGLIIFGMMRAEAKQKLRPLPSDVYYNERMQRMKKLPELGVFAGVTPICLLYLLYVFSQANYFFSAFAGQLPDNMAYSEYARRGFFELCAIAVINLGVILFMLAFSKRKNEGRCAALKFYNTALCGFTLFIIATALAKMIMYIGEYGLTRLRLYTAWFMVLLAVIFTVLLIRGFVPKLRTASVISAAFIALFGVLCFSRPDALIAQYNITAYENGTLDRLDVSTLCELSDDAYVVMLEHYDTVHGIESRWYNDNTDVFDYELECRIEKYERDPFRTYNFSAQKLKAMYEAKQSV
ncbi:MAG: DUF4173 domain-containing protein [Ruminiclostridium sp.]|nr:DUF4173 domain-containing protein [Ruminiclostridium sp.]